ncbi:methyltransferase domain-containing protein (plasmid) [Leptolyngbya sp. NK1-12]|jgi:ubiquinone/menaquinone biosynthesis C-methylase UbiE|uniref:Methyltransferase domain-containing protein n=1 Tax=Leptolyngbya sp. NK1-12 TaxID=2547451 RepID=A0AA96WM30_9CYAN|nr:class I SAM-dependent methyltransferase [Leptolyngbya sp. NK1-12]WNZ28048.1 methyltransferase domain-containing protein [Leptolyngbya sp. NK1-12]
MTEAKVRAQYDQLATRYDQRWSHYVSNTLSFLKTWAQIAPTDVVLDIACGTGEFERLILSENPVQPMVGVDISDEMLAVARQKLQPYPNVRFQHASASALPFPDTSFDTVISANAFHYFDDPNVALQEMKRVLKPHGDLIILDWCKDFLVCRICDWVLQRIDPAHQQCYTQAEFHRLISNAGFRIRQSSTVRFGLVWGLMVATATPHSVQSLNA